MHGRLCVLCDAGGRYTELCAATARREVEITFGVEVIRHAITWRTGPLAPRGEGPMLQLPRRCCRGESMVHSNTEVSPPLPSAYLHLAAHNLPLLQTHTAPVESCRAPRSSPARCRRHTDLPGVINLHIPATYGTSTATPAANGYHASQSARRHSVFTGWCSSLL